MKYLIVFVSCLIITSCSTSQIKTTEPAPALSATQAEAPPVITMKQKPFRSIQWDGPCSKKESETQISGFNLKIMDPQQKLLTQKFVPVQKKDPQACKAYTVKIKNVVSKDLAQQITRGKFVGTISITSVAKNSQKTESPALTLAIVPAL